MPCFSSWSSLSLSLVSFPPLLKNKITFSFSFSLSQFTVTTTTNTHTLTALLLQKPKACMHSSLSAYTPPTFIFSGEWNPSFINGDYILAFNQFYLISLGKPHLLLLNETTEHITFCSPKMYFFHFHLSQQLYSLTTTVLCTTTLA